MATTVLKCPKCGMNMHAANYPSGIVFACGWYYCEAYGLHFSERQILIQPKLTQAEVDAYRNKVYPPVPNIPASAFNWYSQWYYAQQVSGVTPTLDEAPEMKEVNVTYLYNNTIIELQFVTLPRRGWFHDNIQPIIDIIKATIPSSSREYNPDSKRWQLAAEFWKPLEQILTASHFKINIISASSASAPRGVHVDESYAKNFHYEQVVIKQVESKESIAKQLGALLGIHEDLAVLEIVELKKKYREAARRYHPDLGGDSQKMSELNRLWSIYNTN